MSNDKVDSIFMQVSGGVCHVVSCTMCHLRNDFLRPCLFHGKSSQNTPLLKEFPYLLYTNVYQFSNYFSHNILLSWRLFSFYQMSKKEVIGTFYVTFLHDSISLLIISQTHVKRLMRSVLTRTTNSSSHGPLVTINRTESLSLSLSLFHVHSRTPTQICLQSRLY